MTRRSSEVCERCDAWSPLTAGLHKGVMGECRKEAPRLDFSRKDGGGRGVFPLTRRDHWCGRFDREVSMPV
jgi:hypothetical protein